MQARLRVMHAEPRLRIAMAGVLDTMRGLPVIILTGPMYGALKEAEQAALPAAIKPAQ